MRQHGEKLILVAIRLLQCLLGARPLGHFLLQAAVGALELGVGTLQRRVEGLELAVFFGLQREVGFRKSLVGARQSAVQLTQLAALAVQLDQHRHLAAQDLRHHGNGHVVDRARLVAAQPVELGDVDPGDEDDGSFLEARVGMDQLGRLEAVHLRHADIEQHHRELFAQKLVERVGARVREHQILPEIAQDGLIGEQPCRLVIDQQDVHPVIDSHGTLGCEAVAAPQGCSHKRTSDNSWSVFTGLAT